jgi:hypothetical protein
LPVEARLLHHGLARLVRILDRRGWVAGGANGGRRVRDESPHLAGQGPPPAVEFPLRSDWTHSASGDRPDPLQHPGLQGRSTDGYHDLRKSGPAHRSSAGGRQGCLVGASVDSGSGRPVPATGAVTSPVAFASLDRPRAALKNRRRDSRCVGSCSWPLRRPF